VTVSSEGVAEQLSFLVDQVLRMEVRVESLERLLSVC